MSFVMTEKKKAKIFEAFDDAWQSFVENNLWEAFLDEAGYSELRGEAWLKVQEEASDIHDALLKEWSEGKWRDAKFEMLHALFEQAP